MNLCVFFFVCRRLPLYSILLFILIFVDVWMWVALCTPQCLTHFSFSLLFFFSFFLWVCDLGRKEALPFPPFFGLTTFSWCTRLLNSRDVLSRWTIKCFSKFPLLFFSVHLCTPHSIFYLMLGTFAMPMSFSGSWWSRCFILLILLHLHLLWAANKL